jgi:pantoate--beta-alanine ligase
MIIASTRKSLATSLTLVRAEGSRLGLVPTMGYLHEGHLSLVDLARDRSDFVAVSVFVNPLQFGPGEDLDRYPRNLDQDLRLLRERGVDLAFAPSGDEMYPFGSPHVTVDPGPRAEVLCGRFRPGHFRGVLTVVARLLGLFRPHHAVFGQKDYQQAALIRTMVRDLELGVDIGLGPIVRDEDGLALSSRNVFLSPEERSQATGLWRSLRAAQVAFKGGERSVPALRSLVLDEMGNYPLLELEYVEFVHPETLDPTELVEPGFVVAVAAHCGRTRLIDNHIFAE